MDNLPQWAQNSWVLGFALTSGIGLFLGMFAKFCPKKKLVAWVEKPCRGLGIAISKMLVLRLGKGAAERIEEGIIVTLLEVVGKGVLAVQAGLLSDNEKKKK